MVTKPKEEILPTKNGIDSSLEDIVIKKIARSGNRSPGMSTRQPLMLTEGPDLKNIGPETKRKITDHRETPKEAIVMPGRSIEETEGK